LKAVRESSQVSRKPNADDINHTPHQHLISSPPQTTITRINTKHHQRKKNKHGSKHAQQHPCVLATARDTYTPSEDNQQQYHRRKITIANTSHLDENVDRSKEMRKKEHQDQTTMKTEHESSAVTTAVMTEKPQNLTDLNRK
jgi:hypothetical protein